MEGAFTYAKQSEAVVRRCSSRYSSELRNIYRKAPVLESLFNKVAGLEAKGTPTQMFSCEY